MPVTGPMLRGALLALVWTVVSGSAALADWDAARREALAVREALQADISAMRRLRAAQKELMDWNLERGEVGSAVRTLRPEVCGQDELKRWCELFPATFGVREDEL